MSISQNWRYLNVNTGTGYYVKAGICFFSEIFFFQSKTRQLFLCLFFHVSWLLHIMSTITYDRHVWVIVQTISKQIWTSKHFNWNTMSKIGVRFCTYLLRCWNSTKVFLRCESLKTRISILRSLICLQAVLFLGPVRLHRVSSSFQLPSISNLHNLIF